jgi:hypothetical protein
MLLLMPFLPFVDTASGLWLGLPRMLVWGALSCLLLTISLLLVDQAMSRTEGDER